MYVMHVGNVCMFVCIYVCILHVCVCEHFSNILHNFGYHAKSKNEKDMDLKRLDPDILKRNAIDLEGVKSFVTYRYKSGKFDEAHECFKLFDKKDKGTINAADIKSTLTNYLDF